MFGNRFYHSTTRRYVAMFGTLFNDIVIARRNNAGDVVQRMKVPIHYAPMQKILARVEQDPNLNAPAMTLPRMSFEIVNMTFSPERKLPSLNRNTRVSGTAADINLSQYVPAPYDLEFQLNIMTKHTEDGTKILEQILPFFKPDVTVSVKLVDELDLYIDVPVILNSVTMDDSYEGDFLARRVLSWTLGFTVRGYYFGPVSSKKVIKFAEANVLTGADADSLVGTVAAQPGLTSDGNPTNILTGIPASATTSVSGGGISSIDLVQGGSGYGYGEATATISPPTVTRAQATPQVVGEQISYVEITDGGRYYTSVPSFTLSNPTLPAVTAVAVAHSNFSTSGPVENPVNGINGFALDWTGLNKGRYYTAPPLVTVAPPPASIQATANPVFGTLLDSTTLQSIDLTSGGTNYATAPTATLQYTTLVDPYVFSGQENTAVYNNVYGVDAFLYSESITMDEGNVQGGESEVNQSKYFAAQLKPTMSLEELSTVGDFFILKQNEPDAPGTIVYGIDTVQYLGTNFRVQYIKVTDAFGNILNPTETFPQYSDFSFVSSTPLNTSINKWRLAGVSYTNDGQDIDIRFNFGGWGTLIVEANVQNDPEYFQALQLLAQSSPTFLSGKKFHIGRMVFSTEDKRTQISAPDFTFPENTYFLKEWSPEFETNTLSLSTEVYRWSVNSIEAFTPITNVASASVTFTNPAPAQAAQVFAVVTNGQISSFNIGDPGFGYFFEDSFYYGDNQVPGSGQVAEMTIAPPEGSPQQFKATVNPIITDGVLTNVEVTYGGLGYSAGANPSLAFPLPETRTATATVNVNQLLKEVESFTITDPGLGYSVPASIVISPPDDVTIPKEDIFESDNWGFIVTIEEE